LSRSVHSPIGEIGRNQIEARVIARHDDVAQRSVAANELLGRPGRLRLASQQVRGRSLRVEIPEQRRPILGGRAIRQIDCRRRLADAAFEIVDANDFHELFPLPSAEDE
jgi:hypothetical protein